MSKFISEDDLSTFEGWLEGIQGIDPTTASPDVLAAWRDIYDEMRKNPTPKVGLMDFKPLAPGEHRYAVAIRDGSGLKRPSFAVSAQRRFPPPWSVEELEACFVVKDSLGAIS
jgi:hypothetical protein